MKIKASVGKAPKTVGLTEQCYSLTLTAQTMGERQWLAGLLRALPAACEAAVFSAEPPCIKVQTTKPK